MIHPQSSLRGGEGREELCSGPAEDEEGDDRLQGIGTLAVSDRRFHCCASSSVWLPALLSDFFISAEDPFFFFFLQACPWR